MRSITFGLLAALVCGPALAATDGKAAVKGPVAQAVMAQGGRTASAADMRSLLVAIFKDGAIDPAEKDLIDELAAAPQRLMVDADGAATVLAGARPDALDVIRLASNVPNLNTLWGLDPVKMQQLVEFSRWGERPRQRIVLYMRNQTIPVFEASNIINAYEPMASFTARVWTVMRAMPDAEAREAGRMLILDAMGGLVYERNKDLLFLVSWLDDDTVKEAAKTIKPLPAAPQP